MPGTASKLYSQAQAKARPSAAARGSVNARATSLVANTPVLFRLPLIPNAPAQKLDAAFGESVQLPTATLAAVVASAPAAASVAAAETETAHHVEPTRSWWEHWSSGIVLIVLLIALATASIMAWQGGDKPSEKLLADTEADTETQSLTDLSAIEVPKLTTPKLDLTTKKYDSANDQNNSLHRDTQLSEELSLIPSESSSLSFDPPAERAAQASNAPAANSASALKPDSHATASLQSPIVKQQEPLFKNEQPTATATISAQPASSATQINASPTGASPSLWDSSSKKPLGSSTESAPQDLSTGKDSDASLQLSGSISGIASPNTPALLTSQTTPETAAPAIDSSVEQHSVPSNLQYAGKTATPELDRAALFATFRQYASAGTSAGTTANTNNMAAANTSSTANSLNTANPNRYATNTPMTSANGSTPTSGANGVPTSMVGYSQQPPAMQQSGLPQPNFTLQSNSGSSPTANQQYSSQQFQPTQYSNQQYQTQPLLPQYQSQPNASGSPQLPPAQQFTAPNSGNGYYVPPVQSVNPNSTGAAIRGGSGTNALSYPSLN